MRLVCRRTADDDEERELFGEAGILKEDAVGAEDEAGILIEEADGVEVSGDVVGGFIELKRIPTIGGDVHGSTPTDGPDLRRRLPGEVKDAVAPGI